VKTQDQIWIALIEANPVPDVDVFGRENKEDATHLATLQQGSSEMTQLSTKQQEETGKRNRSMAWLAAAALVVLAGVALLLFNQGAEEAPVATDPVPTTVAEPVPTTAPEATPTTQPTPTTTVDPAEAEWEAIPLGVFDLEVGQQYRSSPSGFIAPFAYTVPRYDEAEGRRLIRAFDSPEFVIFACEGSSGEECGEVFVLDPRVATVEEAVESTTSRPGASFTEPTPIDVAGAEGVTFDASLDEPGSATLHPMSNGFDQIGILQGERVKGYFVDVAGQPVGIFVIAPETGPFPDEAQALIESIVWKDLG
jgi:hypothetical protein